MRSRALPLTVLVVAQVAVGSAAIMARYGLAAGVLPLPMAAWRLAIAAAVVIAAASLRKRAAPRADRATAARLIVAGVCLGLHFVTWFASLQHISVARSTLLVATCPLWTGLASLLFLRRRMSPRFSIGLAMAFAGIPLVTSSPASAVSGGSPALGDCLSILAAILFTAYMMVTQADQVRLGTGTVVAWTYTAAACAMWLAVGIASPRAAAPATATGWAAILGLALIPQLVGHTALNWSLQHFPAGVVGSATLMEPVFAAALAWWLFGEPVTGLQALGGAIVLAGVGTVLGGAATARRDRPPAGA